MPRVESWTPETWKSKMDIFKKEAEAYRSNFEGEWSANLKQYYGNTGMGSVGSANLTFDNLMELSQGSVAQGDSDIGVNYVFKFTRFVQSQMSSNPPSVVVKPTSTDLDDRNSADAGDRITRFLRDTKDIPEVVDQMALQTLIYGIGCIKPIWDEEAGEVINFDEKTNDVKMTGDIKYYSPSMFNLWLDPKATTLGDLSRVLERKVYTVEEASFRWPDFKEKFSENQLNKNSNETYDFTAGRQYSAAKTPLVEIYEYWEAKMPVNGMAGRKAVFLSDFTFVEKPCRNPHPSGKLPYKFLTYVDVPNLIYGKSVISYASRIQDMLNKIDSNTLDAIQAHNVVRMVIPEGSDIQEDDVSNSNWDWVKISGNSAVGPYFVNPPQLMPDAWKFRDSYRVDIQDLFGINDSMLGIQRREQSAVSQQTSIESGTMIHRRLFKKYERVTQDIYKDSLEWVREKWTTPRMVQVTGKDKAFETLAFKGSDIASGFDIISEYGTSLPIDPNMRREAIMLLMPVFKEAGMPIQTILRHLKLNELDSMYDINEMSADRQRETFEEMIAKYRSGAPEYIAPKEMENHKGRLAMAKEYLETAEFKYLEAELQDMIRHHIKEREELAKQEESALAPADPNVAPAGMPGVSGSLDPTAAASPGQQLQAAGII